MTMAFYAGRVIRELTMENRRSIVVPTRRRCKIALSSCSTSAYPTIPIGKKSESHQSVTARSNANFG
jgi:hypothetical protein